MTKTLATDENNDLYLDADGNIAVFSGLAAVQNICLNASKAQLGEMPLYTAQGIPNFESVWNGVPNLPQFEAALRVTLLSVPNVVSIESLDTQLSQNTVRYTARINTTFGSSVVNGGL